MIRVWSICLLSLLALGCKSGEEPIRGANRGVQPALAHQASPAAEHERRDLPVPEPRDPRRIVIGTTEQEVERDLGAELNAALGVPSDCLRDFVASGPTTIRISVNGIVRPTGMIIEPSAYGSGLSAAALSCIRERIGLVVLQPLKDSTVSETAATVIEFNYEPPVVVESDPGVPEPHLKNVVQPLPKRPEVAPSGTPIQAPTSKAIEGGEKTERSIEGPKPKKISGPKPRAIDGYELDENAQEWR